jgi:alkylhydroperoxidase family enzyme
MAPRIVPLPRERFPEFEPIFKGMDDTLGYVPNSFLTMVREPSILKAVGALMDAMWYPKTVPDALRRLVTYAYSQYAGSMYSSAHCACGGPELGLSMEKILAIHDYEASPVYSEAERSVLRLCRHAARIPSEVTDKDMGDLKSHYNDNEIVFITGLISMMAFLNKWNEIMRTTLEDVPYAWASMNLKPVGWNLDQ